VTRSLGLSSPVSMEFSTYRKALSRNLLFLVLLRFLVCIFVLLGILYEIRLVPGIKSCQLFFVKIYHSFPAPEDRRQGLFTALFRYHRRLRVMSTIRLIGSSSSTINILFAGDI